MALVDPEHLRPDHVLDTLENPVHLERTDGNKSSSIGEAMLKKPLFETFDTGDDISGMIRGNDGGDTDALSMNKHDIIPNGSILARRYDAQLHTKDITISDSTLPANVIDTAEDDGDIDYVTPRDVRGVSEKCGLSNEEDEEMNNGNVSVANNDDVSDIIGQPARSCNSSVKRRKVRR
jgi:hypothetical protein